MADQPVVTRYLAEAAQRWDGVGDWLELLPDAVARVCERWELTVGDPFEPGGATAWVAPARTGDGQDVVLKVGLRHEEAEDEARGLRHWDGRGAVRLLREEKDEATAYLLLEPCRPGERLAEVLPEPDQDVVVTGLLLQAWQARPAPGEFRPLASLATYLADETQAAIECEPSTADHGLVREALAVLRDCPGPASDDVLLVGDLHSDNILSAQREPWLLVDPKPYVGERAFDLTQHLLTSDDRLLADPRGLVARLASMVDVDAADVRRWMFARLLTEDFRTGPLAVLARDLAP